MFGVCVCVRGQRFKVVRKAFKLIHVRFGGPNLILFDTLLLIGLISFTCVGLSEKEVSQKQTIILLR